MFERYTEKARRAIFFARYEAGQFGGPLIDSEHLLLGLLREDKALANRFLRSHTAVESIRKQIEAHRAPAEKLSTSVDLPLSHDCKRVLAYGAEEAERLNHKHIGTEHMLLGLLRDEESFAAQLLHEQGLSLDSAREQVNPAEPPMRRRVFASIERLRQWLDEREARGDLWAAEQKNVGGRTTDIAIYAGDPAKESETGPDMAPGEKLARIQKRLEFIVDRMERAIARHEFETARRYSDEERKERENLRLLREQFNLEELPPLVPLLCIEIISDERFSEVQERCAAFLDEGVALVWILEPDSKRTYTVTKTEGLREFKGEILRTANPPLEMDLRRIFDQGRSGPSGVSPER